MLCNYRALRIRTERDSYCFSESEYSVGGADVKVVLLSFSDYYLLNTSCQERI